MPDMTNIGRIIEYFLGKGKSESFENVLKKNQFKGGLKTFFRKTMFLAVVSFIFSLFALILLNADDLYITIVPAVLAAVSVFAGYFWQEYKFERRKRKIETLVPDMLLQASIFPKGTSAERIISYIANSEYGELSREFMNAKQKIYKGETVENALKEIKESNKSRVLARAINLFLEGYASGADMGQTLQEAADDLLETNSIIRERSANLIIEKYTLLFAGGLIVPVILGLLVGMITKLDFSAIAEFGIGMASGEREAVLGAALLGNTIYIAEYAIIASFFVANQEGNIKKAVLYAAALLPLSIFVYWFAQII